MLHDPALHLSIYTLSHHSISTNTNQGASANQQKCSSHLQSCNIWSLACMGMGAEARPWQKRCGCSLRLHHHDQDMPFACRHGTQGKSIRHGAQGKSISNNACFRTERLERTSPRHLTFLCCRSSKSRSYCVSSVRYTFTTLASRLQVCSACDTMLSLIAAQA